MKTLWFLILFSPRVFAAACCGGGFGLPSIITGDDRAQLTAAMSVAKVNADVQGNGLWRKREQDEFTRTLRIEGAHLLTDRWQAGASLPIVQRERVQRQSSGLGDASVSLGYEYLPEWDYSVWRPKGVGFLQLTAPTGKSIYESEDSIALDSRGRGFWALGAGTVLTKAYRKLDGFFSAELHRSLPKKSAQTDGTLYPGWGGTFTAGAGYNWRDWRAGGSIAQTFEDAVDLRGGNSWQGQEQRYTTGSLAVSYLANEEWAGTLTYSDQTAFGHPVNTSLSKTVAVQLQHRWSR